MFGHNVQSRVQESKTHNNRNNRIQPSLKNIIQSWQVPNRCEDMYKDFFIARWLDQGLGMKEAFQACNKQCAFTKDNYAVQAKSRKNFKYRNGFVSLQNLNK